MEIGARIREIRKMKGMTQIQVADKAKIAVNSLRLYESCKREPNISTLTNIAAALCVPIRSLVPSDERELSWADNIEEKLKHIGFSIAGTHDGSTIWIDGPSCHVPVEFDELEEINMAVDDYLRFKVNELQTKKYKNHPELWKEALLKKLKNAGSK